MKRLCTSSRPSRRDASSSVSRLKKAASACLGAAAVLATTAVAQADEVWLTMDYVTTYKLPRPVDKVYVGNPGIADIEVRDAQNIVLYGKGPGATNMLFLDENGEKVDDLIVRVRAAGGNTLTLQAGQDRTTFNCMSNCEATVTIGDGEAFTRTAGQIQQKFQQARTSAQ